MTASPYVLCRVQFRHAYFADQVLRVLAATPTPATLARLRRAGLWFRPAADGFVLLADAAPRAGLDALFPLVFALQVRDAAFWQYSALPLAPGPDEAYCMRPAPDLPAPAAVAAPEMNAGRPSSPGPGRYERRAGSGTEGTEQVVRPWGLLELGADLLAAAAPAVYTLAFEARPTIWRYHLLPSAAAPSSGAVILTGTDLSFVPHPAPAGGGGLWFEASAPILLAERYGFAPFRLVTAARGNSGPKLLAHLPYATPAGLRCEGVDAEAVFVSDILVRL